VHKVPFHKSKEIKKGTLVGAFSKILFQLLLRCVYLFCQFALKVGRFIFMDNTTLG
jgi:hypothetical protein